MKGVSVNLELRRPNKKEQVMEVGQLKRLKRALKFLQAVAVHDLRENREIIAVDGSADELDQAELSAEREFAVLGLNRRSELQRNIEAALRRIENGTFGTCTNCQETIGRNRLVAVPWTPFCITCQEAVDGGDTGIIKPSYQLDVSAA
jgi:RNA polymerase-binding protein DksA